MRPFLSVKTLFAMFLWLGSGFWLTGRVFAATLTVTTTNDNGAGSLRQAIADAAPGDAINFAVTGAITLTSGELLVINDLTITGPGATNLTVSGNQASRVFEIGSNATASISGLSIIAGHARDGTNATSLTPGGNGSNGGGIYNAGTLSLSACLVNNNSAGNAGSGGSGGGSAYPGGNGGGGGGIFNIGNLTLSACVLTANSGGSGWSPSDNYGTSGSGGGAGGGAYNAGMLIATGCTFSRNLSGYGASGGYDSGSSAGGTGGGGGAGGGVYNQGKLALTSCTFSTNSGGGGGAGGIGGGQSDRGGTGGNGGSGGGIYSANTLWLTNCTFSGNSGGNGGAGNVGGYYSAGGAGGGSGGGGGALYTVNSVLLIACTLSLNSGGNGGQGGSGTSTLGGHGGSGGNGGSGGGIFNSASASAANLRNALIALDSSGAGGAGGAGNPGNSGTSGASGTGPDAAGSFTSQSYNLIGQTNGATGFTNGVNADLAGTTAAPLDPKLGTLTNNGGPTLTLALLPGSPAIDAGDDSLLGPPFNLTTDQRGLPRKSGAHVDIGAFEHQALLLTGLSLGGSDVLISFIAEAGQSYRLERNDTLAPGSWTVVADNLVGTGSIVQVVDTGGASRAQRFYRVRILP